MLQVEIIDYNNNTLCRTDFGVDCLTELVEKTTFPWLMSNVIDKETNAPLGDGKITYVLEKNGKKIGLVCTHIAPDVI